MEEAVEAATQQVTQQVTKQVTEEVEERMANLTEILLNEERFEDLRRITKDKEYRKVLFAEYQI